MSRNFVPLLLFALASCGHPQTNSSQTDAQLCEKLPENLEFVHRTMRENSSNYNGSSEQRRIADEAFKSIASEPCHSNLDFVRAIRKYLASYRDPHVTSLWTKPDAMHATLIEASTGQVPPPPLVHISWTATGVYLQRYNDRYFVKSLDDEVLGRQTQLQVGDELRSCDGRNPNRISDEDILPYSSVSAKEAADYRLAPLIFFRWDQRPGSRVECEFSRPGSEFHVELVRREVPENYLAEKFLKSSQPIYSIEKTKYGHWVKLKTLSGYDKQTISELKSFVQDAQNLRGDRTIVLDIRGNTGGNSAWGTDWIDAVFGYHIEWDGRIQESVFVSPGNIAHYDRFQKYLAATGGIDSDFARDAWGDLSRSLHSHPLGTFAPLKEPASQPDSKHKAKFRGRVIVLTDSKVFSSAETFLEQMRAMPNVIQAGIPSDASTFYSDIRFVLMPAGVSFNFPTKMDSGDPLGRKSGEALKPDWPLQYDVQDELRGVDSLRRALERKLEGNSRRSSAQAE